MKTGGEKQNIDGRETVGFPRLAMDSGSSTHACLHVWVTLVHKCAWKRQQVRGGWSVVPTQNPEPQALFFIP